MKIGVKILPRAEVLDTQGRAVEGFLHRSGHAVGSCRVGKYVILDLASEAREQALAEAGKIADEILHNPLIEAYELEVLKGS